uniref:Magnesium transporter n=1 Tax=Oxyrrhis marina TaxID=2969 RepID=A0A7S4LQD7_OXYMA
MCNHSGQRVADTSVYSSRSGQPGAIAPAGARLCDAAVIDRDGEVTILRGTAREVFRSLWPDFHHHISARRDMRTLSDHRKQDLYFRVRSDYACIRMDYVRAIIEPDRVVIVNPDEEPVAQFIAELKASIPDRKDDDLGFDTWVLESILCACVTTQSMRLSLLTQVADGVLREVTTDSTEDSVVQLFPLRVSTTHTKDQLDMLLEGLKSVELYPLEGRQPRTGAAANGIVSSRAASVLSSPAGSMIEGTDLRSSVLSQRDDQNVGPSFIRSLAAGTPDNVLTEVDEILSTWERNLEELARSCRELGVKIEDTSHFLQASMDSTRNRLLRMDVVIQVTTAAFGFGALVGGTFGMNLDVENSLGIYTKTNEEDVANLRKIMGMDYFWFVCLLMCLAMLGMIVASYIYYVKSQKSRCYSKLVNKYGNNKFFTNVAQPNYILDIFKTGDGGIAKQRSLQEVRQVALSDARLPTVDNSPTGPTPSSLPLLRMRSGIAAGEAEMAATAATH